MSNKPYRPVAKEESLDCTISDCEMLKYLVILLSLLSLNILVLSWIPETTERSKRERQRERGTGGESCVKITQIAIGLLAVA